MSFGGAAFEVSRSPVAPTALRLSAKKIVNDTARRCKTLREFAAGVKDSFEQANGSGWHVLVGPDFAVDLRYRKGACVLLSSQQSKMKVLLYRTTAISTPALRDLQDDDDTEEEEPLPEDAAAAKSTRSKAAKITWFACDMEDDMKRKVLAIAQSRRARLLQQDDVAAKDLDSRLAPAIKQAMSVAYGNTWHVIVSSSRELCCLPHHEPNTLADFALDKFRIIVYRHNGASIDAQVDMLQFANRAALLFAVMCFIVYGYFIFTATEVHERCVAGDNDGAAALPEGCSEQDVATAMARKSWKSGVFVAMIVFTVIASSVRMYRRTLRQKLKQG
ncbi:hypothetical protein PINS_up000880 [Pythium insidiosum]|nr:hypothetical protein PINS_up000880 [Pythium insidiosum]